MPGVAGVEMKYALKKGTTWGTPVAAGANDGVLMLPTGIKVGDAQLDIDDSQGLYFSADGTPGAVKIDGDLPGYLRYDGLDLLIALFMGTANTRTQQAATTAYAYSYDLATNTDGLFATLVRHWKAYVEEIRSLKVVGLTIKGERGKPLQLIAECIGDHAAYDGTNTTSTFNNVTIRETGNRIHMAQGVFRMNAQSGAGLAGGDAIYPSSFELTAKRKMSGIYSGSLTTGGTTPRDIIEEPVADGMPEVTLKLQFPTHTAKTRLTELQSDSRKKMDITFTGGLIASTYYRTFKLEFPNLQMKSVDVVDEAGIIKEPVEFVCHAASAAPTGMTGVTKPFRISGINQLVANPI